MYAFLCESRGVYSRLLFVLITFSSLPRGRICAFMASSAAAFVAKRTVAVRLFRLVVLIRIFSISPMGPNARESDISSAVLEK